MKEKIGDRIRNNQYQINMKNGYLLCRFSALATFLALLLLAASCFIPAIMKNRMLYGGMTGAFLCTFLLSESICKKYERAILPVCYLFWTIAYLVAIELGTDLSPTNPATSFCVLIFALPMLFIDIPVRIDGMLIVVCIAFCCRSWLIKEHHLAELDIVNVASFLFLSICVNYFVLRVKVNDIDNQKKIIWQRDRDSLTQIYNRQAAENIILDYMRSTDKSAILMVVDIDDFKNVNDTLGHHRGDDAIRLVASSIQNELRESDVVGRFGGDEFIAFMLYVKNPDSGSRKAEEIIDRLTRAAEEYAFQEKLSISIGMAMYPEDATDYMELFQKADQALYYAKKAGKNRSEMFRPELQQNS